MKSVLAAVLGLSAAVSLPQAAHAKLSCYPLAQIEQALDTEYGEMRRFTGKESTGIEYRLYVNDKTGTWSWIGIPAGAEVGCLIFAGKGNALPAPAKAPSTPEAQF